LIESEINKAISYGHQKESWKVEAR